MLFQTIDQTIEELETALNVTEERKAELSDECDELSAELEANGDDVDTHAELTELLELYELALNHFNHLDWQLERARRARDA